MADQFPASTRIAPDSAAEVMPGRKCLVRRAWSKGGWARIFGFTDAVEEAVTSAEGADLASISAMNIVVRGVEWKAAEIIEVNFNMFSGVGAIWLAWSLVVGKLTIEAGVEAEVWEVSPGVDTVE